MVGAEARLRVRINEYAPVLLLPVFGKASVLQILHLCRLNGNNISMFIDRTDPKGRGRVEIEKAGRKVLHKVLVFSVPDGLFKGTKIAAFHDSEPAI